MEANDLHVVKRKARIAQKPSAFADDENLAAIARKRSGAPQPETPLKQVELDAILAAPEDYGEDAPLNEDFHVRRLPKRVWRRSASSAGIVAVYPSSQASCCATAAWP